MNTTSHQELQAENERLRARIAELEREPQAQQPDLYRALFEQLPIPVVLYRPDGQAVDINTSNQHLVGVSREAIVGRHNLLADPEAQAKGYADHFAQALAGAVVSMPPTTYNTAEAGLDGRVDDRQIWSETTYFPVVTPGGNYIGEINLDVTEHMATSAAQAQSDAYNKAMLSLFPDLLFRIDRDGVYRDAFGGGDLIGTANQLVGLSLAEVLPDIAQPTLAAIHDALASGEPRSFSYQLLVDGQRRSYEARLVALTADEVLAVVRDITERVQAEQEQTSLQERMIAAQQAALRELSTPLIPVAAGVVVMPLVGAIDGSRIQQIMEALLEGIVAQQAEHAILDITGVRMVDTFVAAGLVQVAQAAKLLGAQVILTGISPEVAQALVGLGADLLGIITRSNLQNGIAYALEPS